MKRYFITNKGKFIDTQAKNVTSIEIIDKDKADKEYGWDCGFICIYYCDDTGDHCETDDKGGKSMDNYDFPDIVKQADTIEEIVDELVFVNRKDKSHEIKSSCSQILKKDIESNLIYGAIWTSKGLKFVAAFDGNWRVI